MLNVHLRWLRRSDMPAILAIENANFEFPWNEQSFHNCLRERNCIGYVAEYDERVVGFMIYELHTNRFHILNFAVHAAMQRRGVGAALVDCVKRKLTPDRRNRVMLEVRESNLDALLFFKAQGFRAISVLKDFYDDTTDDAYLLQFRLQRRSN